MQEDTKVVWESDPLFWSCNLTNFRTCYNNMRTECATESIVFQFQYVHIIFSNKWRVYEAECDFRVKKISHVTRNSIPFTNAYHGGFHITY